MKKLIYKILGLDAETQKRAVVSIITYVIDGLYLFGGIQVPDEKVDYIIKGVLAVITAIVWTHGFYMNENYTPEGCEGTGYTREKKAEKKNNEPEDEEMTVQQGYIPIDENAPTVEELEEAVKYTEDIPETMTDEE